MTLSVIIRVLNYYTTCCLFYIKPRRFSEGRTNLVFGGRQFFTFLVNKTSDLAGFGLSSFIQPNV